MTVLRFLNNWQATIQDATLGVGATTWEIDNAAALELDAISPALSTSNYVVATADNGSAWEVIHITGVAIGSNQITVTRGEESTTPLSYIAGNLIEQRNTAGVYDNFAQKDNVLELDNTDIFTPTADYHPATMKYVDDSVGTGGLTRLGSNVDERIVIFDGADATQVKDGGLLLPTSDIVGLTDTQTLTNKLLSSPKINEAVALTVTSTELNLVTALPNSAHETMGAYTIKGNNTGSSSVPIDMTVAQTLTLLNISDGADETASNPPQAHQASHNNGGGDALKLDDLATPDDNTDLNATTTYHGLLKKLDNDSAHFMNGQGNWVAVDMSGDTSPSLGGDLDADGNTIFNGGLQGVYEVYHNIGNADVVDADSVATAQTPTGSGPITLTASPVTTTIPRRITVTTLNNETGTTYTITYKDQYGASQVSGATAFPDTTTEDAAGGIWVTEVSIISVSGGTIGDIAFGYDENLMLVNYSNGGVQSFHCEQSCGDIEVEFYNWPTSQFGSIALWLYNGGQPTITWPSDTTIVSADTDISANGTDDSYNDSTSGFGTTVKEGDVITISGFTVNAINNGDYTAREDSTTSKIKVHAELTSEGISDPITIVKKGVIFDGGSAPSLTALGGDCLVIGSKDAEQYRIVRSIEDIS
jgi:hypothetical protein